MVLTILVSVVSLLVLLAVFRAVRERILMRRANERLWQNAAMKLNQYFEEGYSRDEVAIVCEHGIPVVRFL